MLSDLLLKSATMRFNLDFFSLTLGPDGCDFEVGWCHWSTKKNRDYTWHLQQGPTASKNTGPFFDHTESSSAYFLFQEYFRLNVTSIYFSFTSSCQETINVINLQSWS